ncbi:MAG TPA: DnaJ domain-containing protein, partial [Natronoarchaeum rubrum]|nr:DnaJ domain-containing protein [Natronoarchaeum rubrum]
MTRLPTPTLRMPTPIPGRPTPIPRTPRSTGRGRRRSRTFSFFLAIIYLRFLCVDKRVSMTNDFYDLLGVDEDASKEEIRDAFREMVQEYHP